MQSSDLPRDIIISEIFQKHIENNEDMLNAIQSMKGSIGSNLDRKRILVHLINELLKQNMILSMKLQDDTTNTCEIKLLKDGNLEILFDNGGIHFFTNGSNYHFIDTVKNNNSGEYEWGRGLFNPPPSDSTYLLRCSQKLTFEQFANKLNGEGFDILNVADATSSLVVNFLHDHFRYDANIPTNDQVTKSVEYIDKHKFNFKFNNFTTIFNSDNITRNDRDYNFIKNQFAVARALLDLTNPLQGGGGKGKMFLLGRFRCVTKVGRKQMITYQKQQISVTEARKLEKQINKNKR